MFVWWIKNDPSNCCSYIHVIKGYYKRILMAHVLQLHILFKITTTILFHQMKKMQKWDIL